MCNLAEMIDDREMPADFQERISLAQQGCCRTPGLIWAALAALPCVPHNPRCFPPPQQFAPPHPCISDNNGAHPCLQLLVLRKKCPPSPLANAFPNFKHPLMLEQQPLFPFPRHPDVTAICQQPRVPVYPTPSPSLSRPSDAGQGCAVEVATAWLCV